jgi:hypothetical protein
MIQIIPGPIMQPGESLSPAADCRDGKIVRLTMPAQWTDAVLSFQISSDDQGYNDLYDHTGNEVIVRVVPGSAVIVPVDLLAAAAFIKFRSGTHEYPVPQPEQRDFAIALEVSDVVAPARTPPTVAPKSRKAKKRRR